MECITAVKNKNMYSKDKLAVERGVWAVKKIEWREQ